MITALLELVLGFASIVYETEPDPAPLEPEFIVIQLAVVDAVQLHELEVVTLMEPFPPFASIWSLAGFIE